MNAPAAAHDILHAFRSHVRHPSLVESETLPDENQKLSIVDARDDAQMNHQLTKPVLPAARLAPPMSFPRHRSSTQHLATLAVRVFIIENTADARHVIYGAHSSSMNIPIHNTAYNDRHVAPFACSPAHELAYPKARDSGHIDQQKLDTHDQETTA